MIFWGQQCALGSSVVVAVDVVVVVVVGGGAPAWAVDNQTKQIQVHMHQFKRRTPVGNSWFDHLLWFPQMAGNHTSMLLSEKLLCS